jgi:CheY-like chemotaxis protein
MRLPEESAHFPGHAKTSESIISPRGSSAGARKHSRSQRRFSFSGPALIVDDILDDANLAKRVLARLHPDLPILVFTTAREAVAHLEKSLAEGVPGSAASLILLDLKMPEMDGFAFLEWVKLQPEHADIPIIVLTAHDDLAHLRRAYGLHARAFLLKPVNLDSLRSVLTSLNLAY